MLPSALATACTVLLLAASSHGASHTFQLNEPVKLYANKVGPFSNPRYCDLTLTEHFVFDNQDFSSAVCNPVRHTNTTTCHSAERRMALSINQRLLER